MSFKYEHQSAMQNIKVNVDYVKIINNPDVIYVIHSVAPYFNLTLAGLRNENNKNKYAFFNPNGKIVEFKDNKNHAFKTFTNKKSYSSYFCPINAVSTLANGCINAAVDQYGNLYSNKEFKILDSIINCQNIFNKQEIIEQINNIDPSNLLNESRLKTYNQTILCTMAAMHSYNYYYDAKNNKNFKESIKQIEQAYNDKLKQVEELKNQTELS